jgi:hypothetical protein
MLSSLGPAGGLFLGRHDYAFLHAQVLARQQEFEQARSSLGPFMTPAYPADVRTAARNLMGFIVEMEQARQAGGRPAAGAAPPGSSPTDTTTRGRPAFRSLQPGEERLEGILERLECVEGQGIIFHVRTGDTVVTALAPSLSNVDFITFRDDLRGGVTCGPFTPAMAVYLTWRRSPDAPDTKIVVAVEFLPKGE